MNDNLKIIEDFFNIDVKIKEMISSLKPTIQDLYDDYTIDEYMKRFFEMLKEIKHYFYKIVDAFRYDQKIKDIIDNRFQEYEKQILSCNYRLNKENLMKIYEESCSKIYPDIANNAKKEFVGYTLVRGNLTGMINKCHTINEILHVVHCAIVNDERYYQSMPKIATKVNEENNPIVLYGKQNEYAQEIFNKFPVEMNCGYTDIISLDNKVLMMIRDKGHALTVEVDIEGDVIWVSYSIPKICNVDMVNALQGIEPIDESATFAKGLFRTNKENFSNEVINLINGVPTDMDMVFHHR